MANNRFIYSILAAFIAGMLLLVFIQYNSSRSIDQLIEGNRLLLNDMKVANDLRETERDILSVESKIRAAVATGDSSFAAGIDAQIANAEANLDTLQTLSGDPNTRADYQRLAVLAREKLDKKNLMLDSFFHAGRKPDKSVIANPRSRGAANEINMIIRRLYANRKERLAAISASVTKYGRIARTSGIVLITLVLLTGIGLFWFIIDRIRRQNELIRQLDRSERQLQDAVQIKEKFLANMSHEIRTPLNSIIGFTRLLAKQSLNADSREFVEAIGSSGESLLTLINDILDLSKIEAGMMRVDVRPFSVRELFHSVETLFQHRVQEKGLTLSVDVEADVPDLLSGDPTRLTQIIVNLISNATKFTEEGRITVLVSAKKVEDLVQLWVEVEDTGIGISRDQLPFIFERFLQAEGAATRKYAGTGLGLSIVKELIELQQGSIAVESEPGKGSRFHFIIPYKIISSAPAALQQGITGAALPRMDGTWILVADDNRMNQRLMEHLLSGAGISFDIVDDGRKAVDRLRNKAYHLVLMDIQMPMLDGYMATRMIREELGSAVPIVAMTAHAMRGEREKCLESGMNEYLSKPIDAEDLFRVIERLVKVECTSDGVVKDVPDSAESTRAGLAAEKAPARSETYVFIDIGYLRELSGGDRDYEVEMADQFLQAVPEELEQLEVALKEGDGAAASRVAHSLKTTVSIMGMTERLFVLLQMLEYPEGGSDLFLVAGTLRQVCMRALEEAARFRR
jgi:signal transduction histidine kinase/CheY-like chemotaxis protein